MTEPPSQPLPVRRGPLLWSIFAVLCAVALGWLGWSAWPTSPAPSPAETARIRRAAESKNAARREIRARAVLPDEPPPPPPPTP